MDPRGWGTYKSVTGTKGRGNQGGGGEDRDESPFPRRG